MRNPTAATKTWHTRHHEERFDGREAFLRDPRNGASNLRPDDLAEILGEEFVFSATSGEEVSGDSRDEFYTEEVGGPFVGRMAAPFGRKRRPRRAASRAALRSYR